MNCRKVYTCMVGKYSDIIFQVVNSNIGNILDGESISPGHNGPYYDEETDVRNTAHWIMLCACCFVLSNEERYKIAVRNLANRLYDSPFLCKNFVYISRYSKKDSINGTVGPAWIIEGLVKASEILHDDKYVNLAIKVFKSQKFIEKNSLWTRINENGRDIGFDLTYNHELWFAAAGSIIIDYCYDEAIDAQINSFLSMSIKGVRVLPDGILNHYVDTWVGMKRAISFNKQYYIKLLNDVRNKPSMRYKEEGYHLFSMYAFAILYKRYGSHPFFKCKKFLKALDITFNKRFIEKLEHANPMLDGTHITKKSILHTLNAYAYPYNAPGFELPYIAKVFYPSDANIANESAEAFDKQISLTYDPDKKIFCRNTEDERVLTARLYELTRVFQ